MASIDDLAAQLTATFARGPQRVEAWFDNQTNSRIFAKVRARHESPGIQVEERTVHAALAYFRAHGRPDGWRGMKYACIGVGSTDPNGWTLLADRPLLASLLTRAAAQKEERRRLKCFQGLLAAYWSFPASVSDGDLRAGWEALRAWLAARLPQMLQLAVRQPEWLRTLGEHKNLLTTEPCARYSQKLIAGDGSEFESVLLSLGIPSASWVPEEAVMAQIRTTTSERDSRYIELLPRLLALSTNRGGVRLADSIKLKCVALIVSRYARCTTHPEHDGLRDAAVGTIGNPWLRRSAWDSAVVDKDGRPDNQAREMVFGWLKRRLIADFFELLAADGTGDRRRLDYWLRFEPFIEDMWFALGAAARAARGDKFDDFRARAKGRLMYLTDANAQNNAFLMRIGRHLAVEFGATGNAFYLHEQEKLPSTLAERLWISDRSPWVGLDELKDRSEEPFRKNHTDSPVAMDSWEQKFDDEICPRFGVRPTVRPAFVPELERLLAGSPAIRCEDSRRKDGRIWVYTDKSNAIRSSGLRSLGFRYQAGQGWSRHFWVIN